MKTSERILICVWIVCFTFAFFCMAKMQSENKIQIKLLYQRLVGTQRHMGALGYFIHEDGGQMWKDLAAISKANGQDYQDLVCHYDERKKKTLNIIKHIYLDDAPDLPEEMQYLTTEHNCENLTEFIKHEGKC